MKKILEEKGSVFKKIISWVLVMAILFTSVDMSAFAVRADEQDSVVFSDDISDSEDVGSEIQQNDDFVSEEQTQDSSVTDPQISFEEEMLPPEDTSSENEVTEEGEEQLQTEITEEEQPFSDGEQEEVFSDGTESDTELAANAPGNPVQWSTMTYGGGRVYLSYRYKGVNHSNRNYPWIYGKDASTSELHVAYCIEPDVDDITKWYTLHNKPLTEHPTFKNDPAKAKRMLEYAYFGAEYPGHWSTNELQVEYFMAAQELIWEELGVSNISWHRQTSGGGAGASLNSVVDTRKAEIKRLIKEFNTKPVFENTTLYQDKSDPNKIYTIKLKSGSLSPWGLSKALPSGGVLEYGGFGSRFQFKLNPAMDIRSVRFDYAKAPSKYADMMYYLGSGQQTVIVSGTLPSLSVSCTANVVTVSRVKIKKTDDTGAPVSGVTFKYGTSKTNLNQVTKPTDEKGETEIRLENSGVNTIYVQEHEVPPHLIKSDEIKTVTFTTGGTGTVTFVNDRVRYPVTLGKVEAGTGQPLSGAKFKYWDKEKPETTYTAVTDGEGRFTSTVTFAPGTTVVMEEVSAPEGHLVPEAPDNRQELVISADQSKNVFRFENSVKSARLMIEKYNERTGDSILDGVGCTFKVGTDLSNPRYYETLTIGPGGTATSSHTYKHNTLVYYQEISAPEGFELDDTVRSIVIDASKSTATEIALNKVRVPNKELTLHLKIKKKGSDGLPLQGVRFRLEQRKGNTWYTIASNLVTDRNGTVEIPGTYKKEVIVRGELRLVEEETIPGYKLLDKPIEIDEKYIQAESSEIVIELTNKKLDTRFQVYKYGADTKKPLAGAVFEITDEDGDLLQTLTTNSKGIAETTELLADVTYYIEEIEAPKGYQKIEGRHPFVISTENGAESSGEYLLKREVPNEPYRGRIKVKKVNQDGLPLSGIEFTIYKGALAVEKLTTDEKGEATSDWLTADSAYRIKETYTPPQFEKTELLDYTFDFLNVESQVVGENWKVDVTKNNAGNEITAYFEVTNKELLGRVTIKKVDADEPDLAVQGATFELYNRYDKKTLLASGVTDETGTVVFKNLPIVNPSVNAQQGHYYLEETTPGENHVLPENTGKYFSLTTDQLNYEVMFKNPPVKGSVEILKVDKDNPDKKLEGAEFAIYRADDLNTVLKTEVTGKDGIARFEDLRYGNYVIRETKVPDGYLNDVENGGNDLYDPSIKGYPVAIEKHEQIIPLTIANPAQKVQVEISKCNSENKKPLPYVRFNIMSGDDELIESIVTDSNGKAVSRAIPLDRLGANPYVVEAAQIPGYEPNNTHYPIKIEAGSTQAIQIVKIDVENIPQKTEFKLRKVGDDGEPVEAEFSIAVKGISPVAGKFEKTYFVKTDKETGLYDFQDLISQIAVDAPKQTRMSLQVYETETDPQYQVVEGRIAFLWLIKDSADNYTIDVMMIGQTGNEDQVTYDENTLTITVVNKKIPIRLTLIKYDTDNPDKYLAGAVFRITPLEDGHTPSEDPIEVTTTDSPDGVEIELPYARYYQVQELQAPPGYYTTGGITTYEISRFDEITENGIVIRRELTHTVSNARLPEMKLRKVGENGEPLDAEFIITDEGTERSVTVKTQAKNGGYADVDITALNEFWTVYLDKNRFKIEEISVDNPDYEILKEPVYLDYSIYYGILTFQEPQAGINPDGVTITVEEAPSAATIKIPNKLRKIDISLNLIKEDAEHPGTYLPGAVFEITPDGYDPIRVTTTDSPDGVRVENLPRADSYSVQEIQAPEGYILDPTIYTYTLEEFENEYGSDGKTITAKRLSVNCDNKSVMGNLRIRKMDQENGELLSGAEFEIRKGVPPQSYEDAGSDQYEKVGIITIGMDGTGEYNNIPYGKYFLREIKAPEGYQISKELIPFAVEKNQQMIELDIPNRKLEGELTIVKVDSEDNQKPLAGAVFTIHREDTDQQVGDELITNLDGKIGPISLPYGKYYIKEVRFPAGYGSATGKTYPFELNQINPVYVETIENTKANYGLRIYKRDSETRDLLAGAVFGVFEKGKSPQNADPIVTFKSNASGIATVLLSNPGDYDIYELTPPPGYELLTEKIPVHVDDTMPTVELTIENSRQKLAIEIKKQEEGSKKPLAGAVFEIRNEKTGALIATTDPTNENGEVTVEVPAGNQTYTVTEIKAPEGYILDSTPHKVTVTKEDDGNGNIIYEAEPLVIDNRLIKGNIKLVKVDETDRTIPLAGAVFEVRNESGERVDELTTNSQGEAMSKELTYGKYTLVETQAPDGYELSEQTYKAELSEAEPLVTVTATNARKKGGFVIKKVDAQKPETILPGAEFTIFKSSEDAQNQQNAIEKQKTGADGLARFEQLDYGTYYIRETKAPEGYQLNNRIMAVTVDKDWKEAEPLVAEDYPQPQEGYFRVVKTDKATGSTLAGAEFTVTGPDGYSKVYKTDKSGAFQTDALKPGMYTVTETKAPDGYYISDQPSKTVEVKAGAGTLVEMQEAVFENEQILMPIRIKKTDGDKKDPKPLVGAEFKVYRLEGTDGQSKTEVDTLVTDMHGEAVSRLLPAGSYEVVETQPPKGYELAENPSQKVTINKDSTEETLTFTFVNEILKGTLKIRKVDSETKKVLPGAVFEAYSTEFGVYYRATSADDGYAVFENLPYGIYRIREVEAPEGYELNSDFEKYVEIGKDSPEGGAEITLEVPNTPLMGEIQLTKKDAETGEILEGAVYGIYTRLLENGDIDPTSHMDGYDMVTKAPHVTSKKLSYGTYYVKEITPPDGYKVNDKVYTVTFKENIPLVAIEAEDEAYKGSISVVKKDSATDQPLEGVIFAIFTAEEYEKYQKYQEEGSGDIEELSPIYLTTDETGQASTGNILELGQEYVMVEYAPPAGYDPPVNEDGSEKVWRFTPTKDKMIFEYEIENTKQREIIIHKTDENGNPVNGVVFGLFSYGTDGKPQTDDDKEIAQFATAIDGSGIARYETDDLPNGWYYVKELSCGSAGYEMSKEIVPIEITDDKREYEFDFINYKPRAEIAIQKRDEFGRPLAGARFGLYQFTPDWQEKTDFEEDLIQEFEMDENGYGKIENLLCDLYVIREIEAPQGYRLMEPILVDLLDVEDDIDETKPPKPSEDNVKMTDSGSGISTDWQEEDSPVHITKGEKNGRTYYYYLHNLYNEPLTGWIEIHKEAVSEDGSQIEKIDLSNARFQIIEESGKVVDTVITDQFGRAKSRELPLGTYTIREIQAPDGTQLNGQEGTVVIDGTGVNDIYTYTHKNKIVMGQIKIKKADPAGKVLAGAQFAVYAESGSDGEPVDSITTGEDGTATSKLLPYGWYIIRETKAPEGYELDTNLRLRCRISENEQIVEFTVMNYPGNEPGIYIVKYDKDNPNKYLAGAQFDLYKDAALTEKIGGPYVTEENGQVKITDTGALIEGETYYLKETRAPEGYQLDETAHSFVWGETTTIALYIPNEKEKGYIRFEKTGEMLSEIKDDLSYPNLKELVWEQQQLSGAQIGIYATEEIELDGKTYQPGDLIVRLESGETSPGLPLGTYEYQELSAPPSYILDTQRHKVEVTETTTQIEPAFVSLENQHASVNLQLYKKFSDENTSEKLKQVKFGVYTVGTITSGKVQIEPDTLVGVFGVDENGFANPELKLPQGSYYVRELETADGYLLDETRYPFKVVYDNGNEKIIISSKENPIVNEPVYGVIRLEKKGELFTQVEVSIEENKYQVNRPVFTQGELNGAKVEIRAKETVTIGDSTYQPGEVIDTLISGEKPESRKLPFGTYTVVEVEAPDGYVLDSTPRDVTIRAPEEGSHVHMVELVSLTNAKKKVDLNLYKSFFGLEIEEAEELYQKVLFGVYAAEDIPGAADGVSLKKDTLVELIRIEADGSGSMEKTLLPAGNYYVKELETADGYQVDDTHYPFSVSFGKDVSDTENSDTGSDTITVEVEGIDAEHPLINLPEGAEVPFAFRKIGEDGLPLAGAVFRLYTCKEEHDHSQEAGTEGSCWKEVYGLSPKTSGADGIVDFGILPNGTYQLKETEAPEGYVLPAGQWRFTVNSEAEPGEHIIFTPTGGAQPPAFQKAEEDAVYQYQVMNRKARQMPFTGGTGMLDYAAGGGVLLALAELVNRRRKKKNKGKRAEMQEE